MILSLEQVDHIAELARLQLSQEEKEIYRQQLSAVLEYVSRLQKLDTSGIPPASSVLPSHSVLRQDEPREGMDLQALFSNAPDIERNQFRIPPVLE